HWGRQKQNNPDLPEEIEVAISFEKSALLLFANGVSLVLEGVFRFLGLGLVGRVFEVISLRLQRVLAGVLLLRVAAGECEAEGYGEYRNEF
ncbi:MAG: hypothetical protein ACO1QR_06260, partial [Chthoniobacteraceae bacterium]